MMLKGGTLGPGTGYMKKELESYRSRKTRGKKKTKQLAADIALRQKFLEF